jgi:branched-chain amino acid transport system ATP-binding protein
MIMAASKPLLKIDQLSRSFGGLQAVDNVSFQVQEGQIKALIGPNGAGKTTLFNLVSGNLKPSAGTVFFMDEMITGLKPHEVTVKGLSRTFQNIRLCSHMTVLENVMLGRHVRSRAGFLAGMINLPRTWLEERQIREKAHHFLELFSLGDLSAEEASNLPFGKQRAVEFARALAAEPKLLLLDEPASGLNLHETAELSELIVKIRDMGVTILLVEHDMALVMDISDRIVVLNSGRKIAEGTPKEVQRNRDVINIYLGEDDA